MVSVVLPLSNTQYSNVRISNRGGISKPGKSTVNLNQVKFLEGSKGSLKHCEVSFHTPFRIRGLGVLGVERDTEVRLNANFLQSVVFASWSGASDKLSELVLG